jgi:uncharacterized protein YgbK (DUF1537 family)
MRRALRLPFDPKLHDLLAERIGELTPELLIRTHILIVQAGDTAADVVREIGFCPIEITDGIPAWDWLFDHGGILECFQTVGDSGFAYVLFIEDDGGPLAQLCRSHTEPRSSYMEGRP